MKNAIIFGLLIGVLSAIWIFVTKGHGLFSGYGRYEARYVPFCVLYH